MNCQNCGAQVKDDAAFCQKCGSPITAQPTFTVNNGAEAQASQPAVTFNANNAQQMPQVAPVNQVVTDSPKKSKKKLVVIIVIICVVLALAGAGAAYYFLVFKNSQNVSDAGKADKSKSNISQIDSSAFPEVALYVNAKDPDFDTNASDYKIVETDKDGNEIKSDCKSVKQLSNTDSLYINFVMSQSKELSSNNQMGHAKTAANKLIDSIGDGSNTFAEVTTYSKTINNKQPFTTNSSLLHSAINSVSATGDSAFYDALYWALQRTSLKSGCRYVVAFTDGKDNASQYKEEDVIELSKKTGIPVHIIGIGNISDPEKIEAFANSCKGDFYQSSNDDSNMESSLSDAFTNIYNTEKSMYKVSFTSGVATDKKEYRKAKLVKDDEVICDDVTYVAENDVSPFVNKAVEGDYVLPESNTRYYTEAELQAMSIWDLYLARNEIYARHGRDFKHQDLKDYFATKSWYKVLYSPTEFDAHHTSELNDFERKNAELMLAIEKSRNSPYLAP